MRTEGGASPTMRAHSSTDTPAIVAIGVELCAICSTPYDYQVKDAEQKLERQCTGDFTIVEEGTQISANNAVYLTPIGNGLVASSFAAKNYYWVARCRPDNR